MANMPNLARGKRDSYQALSLSNLACLSISDQYLDFPDRSSLLSVLTNALPPLTCEARLAQGPFCLAAIASSVLAFFPGCLTWLRS